MPSETITQRAYVIGVTKQTVIQDLARTFYTLLNNHVNPKGTEKFWFPAFPEADLDNGKLSYPIGTFEILTREEKFTIERKWLIGELSLDIFSNSAAQMDELTQEVINAIDKERGTLWTLNVRKLNMDNMDYAHFQRGQEISIHNKTLTYAFQYPYTEAIFS